MRYGTCDMLKCENMPETPGLYIAIDSFRQYIPDLYKKFKHIDKNKQVQINQ